MNSSASTRRIASNLLWTREGVIRNPLVTVSAEGRILSMEMCPAPDRLAHTEFYAGVLVPNFPEDYQTVFDSFPAQPAASLPELLTRLERQHPGILVVISGLDYDTLQLTPQSRIRKL